MLPVSSSPAGGFRLLGFPIRVKTGFLLVPVLFLLRDRAIGMNYVLASIAAYAVFMVVHELGHAVAARKFGCRDVSISLDFLVGYAAFRPPATITKGRMALISVAGPGAEILLGLVGLVAMGADLTSFHTMTPGYRGILLWFGPILGLANLIPILPLDGGNIVALGFERLLPGRGRYRYQQASLAMAGMLTVAGVLRSRSGSLSALLLPGVMLLAMNWGVLSASRPANVANDPATGAAAAEAMSWHTGKLQPFPADTSPSPWLTASLLHRSGDRVGAARTLGDSLAFSSGYWHLADDAPHDALLALVELVPEAASVENLQAARTFHHVLHRLGYLQRAIAYGARIFERHRDSFTAHQLATELAVLGHSDPAMAWLRTALADPAEHDRLSDSGLDSLRSRPDWASAIGMPPPR